MYYIAYGSNLDSKTRKDNGFNFKFITKYNLINYKLAFKSYNNSNSFLTLEEEYNSVVETVIYEIDDDTLNKLDIYEEIDNNLYYKKYIKVNINDKECDALIYLMNKDSVLSLPKHNYFMKVYNGYKENEFDVERLFKATDEIDYEMKDIMTNCFLYLSSGLNHSDELNTRTLLDEINSTKYLDFKSREILGRRLFGSVGKNLVFNKPFHCDHGYNIHIGDNFYSNFNLTILDTSKVTIGNNCFIGPNVSIVCPIHPIDAPCRNTFFEGSKDIVIKDNVWICSNVVINGGVTIGENVVVASGSVVTKSLGDNVVIGGNPARVIRTIGESDRIKWEEEIEISKRLINKFNN